MAFISACLFMACSEKAADKNAADEQIVNQSEKAQEAVNPYAFDDIVVKIDVEIPDCEKRELAGRLIFVKSAHCPHCKKAQPIIDRLVKERGLEDAFEVVDTTTEEGRDVLAGGGLLVQYVPTLIYNCKAYVGAGHVDAYKDILPKKGE